MNGIIKGKYMSVNYLFTFIIKTGRTRDCAVGHLCSYIHERVHFPISVLRDRSAHSLYNFNWQMLLAVSIIEPPYAEWVLFYAQARIKCIPCTWKFAADAACGPRGE